MNATPLQDKTLEQLARKRASAKMGWYIHAFGWGIGLAIHGFVVFIVSGGAGLHQRLVQQERERLTLQRDPW